MPSKVTKSSRLDVLNEPARATPRSGASSARRSTSIGPRTPVLRPPNGTPSLYRIADTGSAKNRLGAILDAAQREPIVIRRQDRDIAVVLSMADYDRLRSANIAALLELRDEVAAEAAAAGLTEERLAELLGDDGA